MTREILLYDSVETRVLKSYFDFNGTTLTLVDLWNQSLDGFGRHDIGHSIRHHTHGLLILDCGVFLQIIRWPQSRQHLLEFLSDHGNMLWVWSDMNCFYDISMMDPAELTDLDEAVENKNLVLWMDTEPLPGHWIEKIKNIQLRFWFKWSFQGAPRITGATVDKNSKARAFMMTAIKKPQREHRDILWQELLSRPGLLDRGHVTYHSRDDQWTGQQPILDQWSDGHASMDLYRDSLWEVIPETMYQYGHFLSEKTVKALGTKTPFLVCATPGYLKYLHGLGFQSFHGIIDESYDTMPLIEDRIKMMVDQLEIIAGDPWKFYDLCRPRIEHNLCRLYEIVARWRFDNDLIIHRALVQDRAI